MAAPAARGAALAVFAACVAAGGVLDECAGRNARCAAHQRCVDRNTSAASVGDWECRCDPPALGAATGGHATCLIDECLLHGERCRAELQQCRDPDTTARGDWYCDCAYPALRVGAPNPRGAAACMLDECLVWGAECANAGQRCRDRSPLRRGDWFCECPPPLHGRRVGGAADCTLPGPSQTPTPDACPSAAAAVCTTAGQVCVGVSPPTAADTAAAAAGASSWECRCLWPLVGSAVEAAAACREGEGRNASTSTSQPATSLPSPPPPGALVVPHTHAHTHAHAHAHADGDHGSPPGSGAAGTSPEGCGSGGSGVVGLGLSCERQRRVYAVAAPGALFAGILGGPVGAVQVGQLALVRSLRCDVDTNSTTAAAGGGSGTALLRGGFDFELHPTGVALWGGRTERAAGAATMNAALLLGLVLLLYATAAVAYLRSRVHGAATPPSDVFTASKLSLVQRADAALGRVGAPGAAIVPFLFLLPGTLHASLLLVLNSGPDASGATALGGTALCACIFETWMVCSVVVWRVDIKATTVCDPCCEEPRQSGGAGALYRRVFGERVWVTRNGGYFCEKYGAVFDGLRGGKTWWIAVEIVVAYAVVLLATLEPSSRGACNVRNTALCGVLGCMAAAAVCVRPYLAAVDNAIRCGLGGLAVAAVGCLSAAMVHDAPDTAWHAATEHLLTAASCVLLAAAVARRCVRCGDWWLGRTAGVRAAHRSGLRATALGVPAPCDTPSACDHPLHPEPPASNADSRRLSNPIPPPPRPRRSSGDTSSPDFAERSGCTGQRRRVSSGGASASASASALLPLVPTFSLSDPLQESTHTVGGGVRVVRAGTPRRATDPCAQGLLPPPQRRRRGSAASSVADGDGVGVGVVVPGRRRVSAGDASGPLGGGVLPAPPRLPADARTYDSLLGPLREHELQRDGGLTETNYCATLPMGVGSPLVRSVDTRAPARLCRSPLAPRAPAAVGQPQHRRSFSRGSGGGTPL